MNNYIGVHHFLADIFVITSSKGEEPLPAEHSVASVWDFAKSLTDLLKDFTPVFFLQAPKKAKRRQAAGDGGSSNVFSMFEQSQIQEYKEVRFVCTYSDTPSLQEPPFPIVWALLRATPGNIRHLCYLWLTDIKKNLRFWIKTCLISITFLRDGNQN